MIDGETGDIVLRDGTRLGRGLTRDEFVWTSPLYRAARRGEGAAGWTSWYLDLELQRGGPFRVCLRFQEDALKRIELTMPADGNPFAADAKLKAAHDRWVEEVLGAPPPVKRPWGHVSSVADLRSGGCQILVFYL